MKLALHWKILIGMVLGLVFGFVMKNLELKGIVVDWVKPFGTVFINLLKMIAVPLIVVSLIVGLSDLKDISKLSKLGLRTVVLYLITTVTAVSIGLVLANIIQPGNYINEASRNSLLENFAGDAAQKIRDKVAQETFGVGHGRGKVRDCVGYRLQNGRQRLYAPCATGLRKTVRV